MRSENLYRQLTFIKSLSFLHKDFQSLAEIYRPPILHLMMAAKYRTKHPIYYAFLRPLHDMGRCAHDLPTLPRQSKRGKQRPGTLRK